MGDIKLSKTEFRQIYWSIDENNLALLATMATTSAIDGAIQRKMQEQENQSLWSSQIKIYGWYQNKKITKKFWSIDWWS